MAAYLSLTSTALTLIQLPLPPITSHHHCHSLLFLLPSPSAASPPLPQPSPCIFYFYFCFYSLGISLYPVILLSVWNTLPSVGFHRIWHLGLSHPATELTFSKLITSRIIISARLFRIFWELSLKENFWGQKLATPPH